MSIGIDKKSVAYNSSRKWLVLIFGLTILIYARSLVGGFVWDDVTYFVYNDIIPDIKPWDIDKIVFSPISYWGGTSPPIRDFLFVLQFYLFEDIAYGYHVVSLLLYILIALVVYVSISSFYDDFIGQRKQVFRRISNGNLSALIVTSLFLLHPVHVEAVANIISQKDLLYSLFSCLSVMYFYKLFKDEAYWKWKDFVYALFFYYSAFLSKPTAVSTAMFVPVLWVFVSKNRANFIKMFGAWFVINVPVFLWIIYFISSAKVVSHSDLSSVDLWLRGMRILGAHTILVFKPFPLNFGYPFNAEWSFDINFIIGLAVLLALVLTLFIRPRSMVTLGLLIYSIYIFPMLQIAIQVSNAIVYDRYLFVPLLGMCIIFERGLFFALSKWKRLQNVFISIFIVILAALSFQTFSYIPKFSSDVASLEHAYYTFPGWKRAAFDYVDALIEAKKFEEAWRITKIEKTFSQPVWVRDYFRGRILLEKGQVDDAMKHLHRASYYTHLGGYFPFADIKLGKVYILKKDYNRARTFLNNVINAKIHNPLDYYRAKKMLEEIKLR